MKFKGYNKSLICLMMSRCFFVSSLFQYPSTNAIAVRVNVSQGKINSISVLSVLMKSKKVSMAGSSETKANPNTTLPTPAIDDIVILTNAASSFKAANSISSLVITECFRLKLSKTLKTTSNSLSIDPESAGELRTGNSHPSRCCGPWQKLVTMLRLIIERKCESTLQALSGLIYNPQYDGID